jgi:hypothetical protein
MTREATFGPFEVAFNRPAPDRVAPYLELLNFAPGAGEALDLVRACLDSSPAPGTFVKEMLSQPDWRPHLVAAVAIILDGGERLVPQDLWGASDRGSWVIPQLVAAAYLADPDFPREARMRIEGGCLVQLELPRSVAVRSRPHRSAKLTAALVQVSRRVPSMAAWLEVATARPSVQQLMREDLDDAPGIAESWLRGLAAVLAQRGRDLRPKCR